MAGLKFVEDVTTTRRIWFITLKNNQLTFWSGIRILPDVNRLRSIKEGSSFIKQPNGYYEAIRKNDGDFSLIFFIPVKTEYSFQNKFLKNTFDKDLLKTNNNAIADLL
jgi:two-component system nitrogen regulation sensor histidine kinase NtrY